MMPSRLRKGHLSEPSDHGAVTAESRATTVEHRDLCWDLDIVEVQNRDLWEESFMSLVLETREKLDY